MKKQHVMKPCCVFSGVFFSKLHKELLIANSSSLQIYLPFSRNNLSSELETHSTNKQNATTSTNPFCIGNEAEACVILPDKLDEECAETCRFLPRGCHSLSPRAVYFSLFPLHSNWQLCDHNCVTRCQQFRKKGIN